MAGCPERTSESGRDTSSQGMRIDYMHQNDELISVTERMESTLSSLSVFSTAFERENAGQPRPQRGP